MALLVEAESDWQFVVEETRREMHDDAEPGTTVWPRLWLVCSPNEPAGRVKGGA